MIYGIGIDIVHIPKFRRTIERWGDRFKEKVFTESELAYCRDKGSPVQHLAVRFAAKEAFIKALGKGTSLTDIEVVNDNSGKPHIIFHSKLNPALSTGQNSKLRTHLSLSHHGDYCIAQILLEVV